MNYLGICVSFFIFFNAYAYAHAGEMLVIQSNDSTEQWDQAYNKALKKILGKHHKIHVFKMNTRELSKDSLQKKAKEAWEKFRKMKPDHIILGDDAAIELLGDRLSKEKVSVVFLGANKNPRASFGDGEYPHNVTGVLERPLVRKSIFALSELMPSTRKVLVLFDNSDASKAALDQRIRKTQKVKGVRVDVRMVSESRDWKKTIMTAEENGYDAILIGHYDSLKDIEGVPVAPEDVISWTNRNTTVPIFGFWNKAVGEGRAVGGLLVDGYEQGIAAAKLLMQVTGGRIPNSVMCMKGRLSFSRSELKRWDIELPKSILLKAELVN